MAVLRRVLTGVFGAVAIAGVPGVALADPPPVPAPQPPDYAVSDGAWYAFSSGGLTCVLQRSGGYGCNGPLPGAPEGANLVSGVMGGVPAFANTAGPVFGPPDAAKP